MKKKHSSKDLRHPKTVKKMEHLGIVSVVCDQNRGHYRQDHSPQPQDENHDG